MATKSVPDNKNKADIKSGANVVTCKSEGALESNNKNREVRDRGATCKSAQRRLQFTSDQDSHVTQSAATSSKLHKRTQTKWKPQPIKIAEPDVMCEMATLRQQNCELQEKLRELQQRYVTLQERHQKMKQEFMTVNMQQAAHVLQSSAELRLMNQRMLENSLLLDEMLLQEDVTPGNLNSQGNL